MRSSSGSKGVTGSEASTREKPEAVRVWLLGGFRVSVGSRALEERHWHLKKAAALVKLLALSPGHHLHREQAMDLLWPDLGKKAASNNLRQVLHGARRTLTADPSMGSRYLASEDESLVLCRGGSLWVDVEAFEESAVMARRSRDPAAYRAAIDLYAGELLPGDRYEGWAEGRREELRHMWLSLHVELARIYEERGEYERGIEALQRAILEEPTNEEAHAGLMRLYAFSDRPGEALAQYQRLQEALSGQLYAEVSATTQRLREDIATSRFPPDQPTVTLTEESSDVGKHNLPTPRTSFVGREQEMVEIRRELTMTRLLTLTGTGGSGKTRLALELARDLVGAYPDGVWLVELAPLSEPELVAQEVAAALEIPERPGQPLTDTLVDALRPKRTLLILDNCEHLVDAAAQLVDILLGTCPHLRVLATSREALSVPGEMNRPVPPLPLPDPQRPSTVEELSGCESCQLFIQRARYRNPAFVLTPNNAWAVAEICRRLEGIPLAIELAAARVGLSAEQIAERLADSLKLLTGGGRTTSRRQKTLRGTLDWSYELLSEPEQKLFEWLAVFAGGWTLEAAEAVGVGGGIDEEDMLDLLGRVVDKSLVLAEASGEGRVRYRMLELVRQYAWERLQMSGDAGEVQGRHAAYFLTLAEEAEPELSGPQQGLWVERLEGEHDNVRAALSWVLQSGESELGLRFGGALWRFWYTRGYLSEGIRWMEEVLAGGEPAAAPAQVKALEGMGWLTQLQGDIERAKATYEEMLEQSRKLGAKGNVATALNSLATLAVTRGDNERARALLEENLSVLRELENERNTATTLKRFHALNLLGILALNEEGNHARATALFEGSLDLAREVGDTNREGATLTNLGYVALLQGDNERATALSEEALAVARELGNAGVDILPEALVNLGLAALGQGNHERATASFKEGLAVAQEVGVKASVINALEAMATLAGTLGEASRVAHLWGAAQAAREITSIALPPGERALHEPYLASARSRLGESAWEAALAEGRAMSLDRAAEYALSEAETATSEQPSSGAQPPNLTPREQEVAVLVAQDLTNRQIASRLMLSEHTIVTHVRNILKKLGLHSRTQIATTFTDHRPLR
jgi:predicted ATPase/DNA-binding SARP family transcriptional activator/DNA-binding CsgD family transcriptional regulator